MLLEQSQSEAIRQKGKAHLAENKKKREALEAGGGQEKGSQSGACIGGWWHSPPAAQWPFWELGGGGSGRLSGDGLLDSAGTYTASASHSDTSL